MGHEVELKFQVPPQHLAALRRAVATAGARQVALAAVYVDTPGEHLARARGALRLRREGEHWVQTLKAEGANPLQRLEHEVLLPTGAEPLLDPARHHGTPAGDWLQRVLAKAQAKAQAKAGGAPLNERYRTEVQRTLRLLRARGMAIELALDEGEITAAAGQRRRPLAELELELKRGTPADLLAVAERWASRFGLVLDVRSKSEQGHVLAAGLPCSPPSRARPLVLAAHIGLPQALAALLANPLQQVLANASVLADLPADAPPHPDHLHQLRVGLRRLRSVLRLYGPLAPQWPADWTAALAELSAALGEARDSDVMAESIWPALRAAGAPLVEGPTAPPHQGANGRPGGVGACLRAPGTQRLWLQLLGATVTTPNPAPHAPVQPLLAAPLQRLLAQVQRGARRFERLEDAQRHQLRRRIKRLRYGLELYASLWPQPVAQGAQHKVVKKAARSASSRPGQPRAEKLLARLAQAQQVLGEFNDTVTAMDHYRALATAGNAPSEEVGTTATAITEFTASPEFTASTAEPSTHPSPATPDGRAWFAVGWLTARRQALLAPCGQALARLAKLPSPWA